MEIKAKEKAKRLDEVRELYDRAANDSSSARDKFRAYDKQYRGEADIDPIHVDENGEVDSAPSKASAVWNISFELLEASIDTLIPQPYVTPELRCIHMERNAHRIESLIRMLMDKNPFEIFNDSQERTVKKFGTAGMNIEWDVKSETHSTVGEIEATPLRPQNIYPQPGIVEIEDCDYVFINYLTTRSALMQRYSLNEEDVENTEMKAEYDGDNIYKPANDEDVVTLTVMWYRSDSGNICRFAYSGDLILEDDDDYYSRRVEYCETCGRRRQICESSRCSNPKYYVNKLDYDELTEDIVCSDGRVIPAFTPEYKDGKIVMETVKMPVTGPDGSQLTEDIEGIPMPAFMEVQVPKMKPTRLPFYKPKKLPIVIRYNIKDDDSFWGISDMEVIRPNQQECNKLTSRIHEAVMKSGSALIKPANAIGTPSNGTFDDVYELDDSTDKNQFALFSYSQDISQWLIERENQKEQAKRLLGITDSFLGQADTTAKSGYAKSLAIGQSAGRLASKKMMKQAHYADIFRVIFELYLAFADEPRMIHHEGDDLERSDCQMAAAERFNRYDFYEFDPKTGEWYIDDSYAFSVDQNGALEHQYPQLWELVKSDYASGMYGDPAQIDTQICAWKHLERLRYPFAKNIVEMKRQQKEQMIAAQQQIPTKQAPVATQPPTPNIHSGDVATPANNTNANGGAI